MAYDLTVKLEAVKSHEAGASIQSICDALAAKYTHMTFRHPTVSSWCKQYKDGIIADAVRAGIHVTGLAVTHNHHPQPKQTNDDTVTIIVIGDQQVKPEIDLRPCQRIGKYIAHKKPKIVVNIGDFADMPSLSFHDVPGSMGYEGQRYKADIIAVHRGMRLMMEPILAEMERDPTWKPRLVMTLGNHEDRIDRTIKATPKLDGLMGLPDLEYERWGWEVIPFLKPIIIENIAFCHYFCSGQMGRPISSARAMLNKLHMSCVAGHQQGRDMAIGKRADGSSITAIINGSSYEHDEGYLNHQTNNHWRGIYVLNDVRNGSFEEMAVSMAYLARKYP